MEEAQQNSEHGEAGVVRPGLVKRFLAGPTSLVGSVGRIGRTMRTGADAVAAGAGGLVGASRRALGPSRMESFAGACQRLGVEDEALPRIHNQILLQMYGTLVAGLVALVVGINFMLFFAVGPMVVLSALAIGVTCLTVAAQSSIRALQIRERQLGLAGRWLSNPSQWLPGRLPCDLAIAPGDSRLDPRMTDTLVRSARRKLSIAATFLAVSAWAWCTTPPGAMPGAAMLTLCVAVFGLARASALSLTVLQARSGRDYDLLYWMAHPEHWIVRRVKPG